MNQLSLTSIDMKGGKAYDQDTNTGRTARGIDARHRGAHRRSRSTAQVVMTGNVGARPIRSGATRRSVQPIRLIAAALVVLVVDQATKLLATTMEISWTEPVANPDLALNVAGGHPAALTLLMAATLSLVIVPLLRMHRRGRLPLWAVAALIGGSAGNIMDRAVLGAVRDFIPTPWAILNMADLALVAGVVAYLASSVRHGQSLWHRAPRQDTGHTA